MIRFIRYAGSFVLFALLLTWLSTAYATDLFLTEPAHYGKIDGKVDGKKAIEARNVQISNVRDISITLSWTTDEPTTGHVRLNSRQADDTRGASSSSKTHYVLLDALSPDTTYEVEIVSGGETSQQVSITTGPSLESIPQPDTIYGQLFNEDGVTPAAGAIVYLTLQDHDATGSADQAAGLSSLVDADGFWHTNLGNARTPDLTSSFNYSLAGDQLLIEAEGEGSATQTIETADDAPAPNITLNASGTSAVTTVTSPTVGTQPTPWAWASILTLTALITIAGGWWYRQKKRGIEGN